MSAGITPIAPRDELLAFYRHADALIASTPGRCAQSGKCCRFTEYGHTLFLSLWEAELLFEPGLPDGTALSAHGCPYQHAGQCTARERRPLGCRVYFCNPEYTAQMPVLTESLIGELKALHDRMGIAWDYRPLHQFCEFSGASKPLPGHPDKLPVLDSSLYGK